MSSRSPKRRPGRIDFSPNPTSLQNGEIRTPFIFWWNTIGFRIGRTYSPLGFTSIIRSQLAEPTSCLAISFSPSPFEKSRARGILPACFSQGRSNFMSQHRSLKGASTITAKRNVLKRFERVELLKKRGQWKQGSKVIGLPKTKPDA